MYFLLGKEQSTISWEEQWSLEEPSGSNEPQYPRCGDALFSCFYDRLSHVSLKSPVDHKAHFLYPLSVRASETMIGENEHERSPNAVPLPITYYGLHVYF
jgi:hypothetical protein